MGVRESTNAETQMAGVIGSWRWRTSKRSRVSALRIRAKRAGREDDVGKRAVGRDDHRAADRE